MTDSLTQTAVPPVRAHVGRTAPPRTFFRFMALPIDIRLVIYDELFVCDVDLYRTRCELCWMRECYSGHRVDSANSVSNAHLACTEILRTNKQICCEAIARLYSKNTVHVKCRECEASKSSRLWAFSVEPHRHLSTHIDHYYPYVKNITIAYEIGSAKPDRLLRDLDARWPTIDYTIILRYENTKHISLRIRPSDTSEITVDLARRIYDPSTERVHDYESVLAQANAYDRNDKDGTSALAALEKICDELVLSHTRGDLKFTAFAVRSIRWRPSKEETKEIVVYLGCDKHATSDAFIKSILAKRSIHDEARRRLRHSYLGYG